MAPLTPVVVEGFQPIFQRSLLPVALVLPTRVPISGSKEIYTGVYGVSIKAL